MVSMRKSRLGAWIAVVALALGACSDEGAGAGIDGAPGAGFVDSPAMGSAGSMAFDDPAMAPPSDAIAVPGDTGGVPAVDAMPGTGAPADDTAATDDTGAVADMPPMDAPDVSDDDFAQYHDPGTGPWEMGSAQECKMDPSMVRGRQNLAVFRYGKLCHIQGGNTRIQNWSATKTLGGVLAGRASFLLSDVERAGPGTGPFLHEDRVTDWLSTVRYSIHGEALLSHVMSMTAYNSNLAHGSKRFSYDTVGTREITAIVDVAMAALDQLGGAVPTEERAFMQQEVFDRLGMEDSSWPGGTIGYGWTGSLEDMGRVGVMLVHDGWYGGERFMEASWVYRMSHPAHEDANTAYGQLAWLNSRGGGTSIGAREDDCAPAAFWPSYPHVGSEATDCRATTGDCSQEHDVGVYSAQGLGGQFIAVHPGLDLVIAAHNATNVPALWADVRPAIVAMDPTFTGDEAAFCQAYGAGDYAPDLLVPRLAPEG